jgi:nitric oxide reductase
MLWIQKGCRQLITKYVSLHFQVKPGNLSQDDAVQIAFLLLVAGNATMVNMINLGVVTLFEHPEQLKELKNEPGLSHNFVEELCRYHQGSAMATRRVAKVDVEYGGKVSPPPFPPESRSTSNPIVVRVDVRLWLG